MYAARDPKIYNNTLVDVAKSGHSGLYFGLTYQDWEPKAGRPPSVNPILRNNIVFQSAAENATAVHIRWADELGGMSALSGSPIMSNNRYYIQGGAAEFVDQRPGSEFSGDLAAWKAHIGGDADSTEGDPGLVDLPAGNYHLSAISPCIDAGTSIGAPNMDYEGCTRPQGGGVDIGAYEYMGVVYVSPDGLCDGKTPCYSTIQEGIDWDGLMFTIKAEQGVYGENIVMDRSKKVFFQGGWDAAFTTAFGATQIDSMTICDGTMVVDEGCLTIGGN